eukprot:m.250493 g.250493  ORF g.250493 m.250493 type:complete len:55 (-) comp15438_c0_seq1:3951-4115(-)
MMRVAVQLVTCEFAATLLLSVKDVMQCCLKIEASCRYNINGSSSIKNPFSLCLY